MKQSSTTAPSRPSAILLELFDSRAEASSAAGRRWACGTVGTLARQAKVFSHLASITSATAELVNSNAPFGVVVDGSNRPAGVVRPADLIRAMQQHSVRSIPELGLDDAVSSTLIVRQDEPTWLVAARCASEKAESAIVVDDDGELIGTCRAWDLLAELSDPAIAQTAPADEGHMPRGSGLSPAFGQLPVLQIMSAAESASYDEALSTLTARVCRTASHVVFVVDDDRHPVGIVTPTHVLRSAAQHRGGSLAHLTAAQVGLSPTVSVDCLASIEDAADIFADRGLHWLAVCDSGALVGALSAEHILRLAVASMPAR